MTNFQCGTGYHFFDDHATEYCEGPECVITNTPHNGPSPDFDLCCHKPDRVKVTVVTIQSSLILQNINAVDMNTDDAKREFAESVASTLAGMAGCGVAWCGMVGRGVVWYGGAWRGVVWWGVAWYGGAWRGVVWCHCHPPRNPPPPSLPPPHLSEPAT